MSTTAVTSWNKKKGRKGEKGGRRRRGRLRFKEKTSCRTTSTDGQQDHLVRLRALLHHQLRRCYPDAYATVSERLQHICVPSQRRQSRACIEAHARWHSSKCRIKCAFNMSYQAPEKRANALEGVAALVATESSASAVACAARCQLRDISTHFLVPECRQVFDNVGERALVGPNLPNVSAMPLSVPVST